MLFYRIFPAIAAGCAALMDIQRAKVDNGWLLFCVLVSLFTRIWKMDVSSLETWICGLLVPILILGILFIFRMLGAGDIKLLSVIGSMIGPTGSSDGNRKIAYYNMDTQTMGYALFPNIKLSKLNLVSN